MTLTAKMVASEILMCGVKAGIKQIPIVGEMAVHVVEGLQKRHEALAHTARMDEFDAKLTRVELNMRNTVENEIKTILANLARPAVPGPDLTREMNELRQIYEQGWVPNLFEGLLRNSSHWQEMRCNPKQYGRILDDHDPVDHENGMHLLIDKDTTRILELPASSLAFLLSKQSIGIPAAEVRASQDIWAFPKAGVVNPSQIQTGTRGLIRDVNGEVLYGDEYDLNTNDYLGRLSHRAELVLLDRRVMYDYYIKIRVVSDPDYGSVCVGKIGWVYASSTSFGLNMRRVAEGRYVIDDMPAIV